MKVVVNVFFNKRTIKNSSAIPPINTAAIIIPTVSEILSEAKFMRHFPATAFA